MKRKKLKYVVLSLLIFVMILGLIDLSFIYSTMDCDSVILKSTGQAYYQAKWLPDKKIINNFESKLGNYLLGQCIYNFFVHSNEIPHSANIFFVIKNLKSYKRQYVGTIIKGKKILHCNCLIIYDKNKSLDISLQNRWENNYIDVCDGGPRFFYINFDVTKNSFQDLFINM